MAELPQMTIDYLRKHGVSSQRIQQIAASIEGLGKSAIQANTAYKGTDDETAVTQDDIEAVADSGNQHEDEPVTRKEIADAIEGVMESVITPILDVVEQQSKAIAALQQHLGYEGAPGNDVKAASVSPLQKMLGLTPIGSSQAEVSQSESIANQRPAAPKQNNSKAASQYGSLDDFLPIERILEASDSPGGVNSLIDGSRR